MVKKNDIEAYKILVRRHLDFVNETGVRLVGNKTEGLNLSTVTLSAVWVNRKTIPKEFMCKTARFKIYLFRSIKIYHRQNSV